MAPVNLTLLVKLQPTAAQKGALLETMERFNAACNAVAEVAFRERTTVRKAQRRVQHRWSFHQLGSFIQYKARLAGVAVVLVDPRNNWRACPECGTIDKANRPTRGRFCCVSCGARWPGGSNRCGEHSPQGCCQPAGRGFSLAPSCKPPALSRGEEVTAIPATRAL